MKLYVLMNTAYASHTEMKVIVDIALPWQQARWEYASFPKARKLGFLRCLQLEVYPVRSSAARGI